MGFTKLKVHPKLIEGIKLMGITVPTPIQEKCIPEIKAGKDVVGQSLTGSGKTAAFGLPILEKIIPGGGLQALVLTPTRELCVQVRDHLEMMARFLPINVISIYGGVGYFDQTEGLKIAEIIVATPGRLLDHIGRRNVDFGQLKFVVLDEADKMFEMGFEEDVSKILAQTPKNRQTVLFSATMPKAAQNVVRKYLRNPVFIQEKLLVDKSLLKQVFYVVRKDDKFSLLAHLLKKKTPGPAIVFCGTKREVDRVARNLRRQKIDVMPVHGDLSQSRRQLAVDLFKKAKIDVLIATDVAARGLDIKDVTHVYNYDVPRTPDEYTHRIGRTARAGKKGDAVTLLSERDYDNFDRILRQKKFEILQEEVPPFERIVFERPAFGNEEGRFGHGNRYGHGERRNYGGGEQYQRHGQGHFNQRQDGGSGFGRRNEYGQRGPSRWNEQGGQSERRQFGGNSNYGQRRRGLGDNQGRGGWQGDSRFNSGGNFSQGQRPVYQQAAQSRGGMERTPRTLEPLFPTSHYNPDHKKFKEKLKANKYAKGHQSGGFKGSKKKFRHGQRR